MPWKNHIMKNIDFNRLYLKLSLTLSQRIGLYERIEAFLDNGYDLIMTLKTIRNRYQKRRKTRSLSKVLDAWIGVMEQGLSFSDAIREWVPTPEYMLISASERNDIMVGLREARVLSRASADAKGAILGGLIFPTVLFSMIIGMLIGFQSQMVPIFSGLLPIDRWPDSAKTLNSISSFLKNNLVFVLLGLGIIGAVITYTLPRWKGEFRTKFIDKLPPWSIYRTYQGSSFLIALSSLMKAGVPTYEALVQMHRTANPWMRFHIEKMMFSIRQGTDNQGSALNTGMLDEDIAGNIEDYGRLGSFTDAIYVVGKDSLVQGVKSIQLKMNMLKNVLLFAVAGSIAWIYLTVYGLQAVIASQANQMRQ